MTLTPAAASQVGSNGLAKVAHAIRRSAALYVAMSISVEGTTEAELFATADRMATWIRGGAQDVPVTTEGFLGKDPWDNG